MLDFLMTSVRQTKKGIPEIYPKFLVKKSSDLMIRGSDFYAIWDEKNSRWTTDEQDAITLIDAELDTYAADYKERYGQDIIVKHLWDAETGMIDVWHKYCQRQLRDSYHMLDETIMFANSPCSKTDYASKRLPYNLEEGSIENYDRLMSVIYSPEEREKIEWAIGSIVCGDSKNLQKFMVLYGAAGTGKSTILNIIQKLFDGYYSIFDAKALGSSTNSFALESFNTNPLVAIQHDGDLSRIEDNTRLNSLVSHEKMTVNEKFKSAYTNQFKAFLFMGTNKPVKITDAKSGLLRRLIDVSPSGLKLDPKEYREVMKKINFELGAIAYHCQEIYLDDPGKYDDYVPLNMMGASNDFYNFVVDSYSIFKKEDGTNLKSAWEMYKNYVTDAKIEYPMTKRVFKEELKNYFEGTDDDEYIGFKYKIFEKDKPSKPKKLTRIQYEIMFSKETSLLDDILKDCPAQLANGQGNPSRKWENVTTKLSDIDPHELHYVMVPINHIVIDFDIPGPDGQKSFDRNLEAASKWPPTYAELSKSGKGIHLHYNYIGDPTKLSNVYDDHIEIKVFNGNSSLRRKLTKCNDLPVANLSESFGLPLKGEKMVNFDSISNEKGLRTIIKRNLAKEIHPGTKPSMDFIYKVLDDAYKSGMHYDVSDMKNAIIGFAAQSTNHADYCLKLVDKMEFKSEDPSDSMESEADCLTFFDVEVFPNLFVIDWKDAGPDKQVVKMINPTPKDIEKLLKKKLVGFNNRKYDNHILYARLLGYTNEELFNLSSKLTGKDKAVQRNATFQEAFNLSYTDVYDFAAAQNKKSLKKWEIELGIHHQELGLDWTKPAPEELWIKVADYCANDVIATEKVFEYLKADFVARQILADLAHGTVNDTTNQLSTKIIFGNNKHPQNEFNYRNLGDMNQDLFPFTVTKVGDFIKTDGKYSVFNDKGQPVFPGYKYEYGKSTYREVEVGEGGRVYAEPGIYFNLALLDVMSMHPHSVLAEQLFGERYTRVFNELLDARVAFKHKDYEIACQMLDGALAKYVKMIEDGLITNKDVATALKTVINSIYGLTSASFPNPFKDPRNIDNIVAKRGALFMINLQHEVQDRGYTVAHIKTDSIKIADADPEIIKFVMDYGEAYGYTFEHEATYSQMCIVNDAVYIAKYAPADWCKEKYGYIPSENEEHENRWTATGAEFAIPYTFKTLFSHEDICFDDLCVTNEVHGESAIYIDMNESLPDVSDTEHELDKFMARLKKLNKEPDEADQLFIDQLNAEIAKGHNYIFVGRIGNFCPIKAGCGGGILVRKTGDKYYALAGTTGYRWLESEQVRELGLQDNVDIDYHEKLAVASREKINTYGDFNAFLNGDREYNFDDGVPPWTSAGEPWDETSSFDIR